MTSTVAGTPVRPSSRDAQRIFRAVLDALARPGTVTRLPLVPGFAAALGPLLALADLDTPVCVLGTDPAAVATATSAPGVELAAARLVAALRPVTAAELGAVRTGTAAAPEDAALVTLAVPALHGGPTYLLSGPGTGAGARLAVAGLPDGWVAARSAAAFPAGADLLLVDPDGGCVGLPRSTRLGSTRLGSTRVGG